MKKLLIIIILIINSTVYSQRVLVLPFNTYDADFFGIMSSVFALEINTRCNYDVIILDSYKTYNQKHIGSAEILDVNYIKNIAYENDANLVVIGSVERFDLRITMSADLININNLKIIGSSYMESYDIDKIVNSVPFMVDEIFNYKGVATHLNKLGKDAPGVADIQKILKVYINALNKSGETAVMIASFYGYADVVAKLIDDGADTEYQRNDGLNALMIAARQNNANVVKVLLDNYADINAKSVNGFDVLTHAAYTGSYDVIKLIVEERYLIDDLSIEQSQIIKNENLYRAMNLADTRGYTRVAQYIFESMRLKKGNKK